MSKENQVITLEKAKKNFKKACILSIIIYVVITALAFIILGGGGVIFAVGLPILFAMLFISEKKKIKRNFCPDCQAKYDFEADIHWSVIQSERVTRSSSSSSSRTASLIAEDKSLVRCECVCPNCGKVTEFNEKVTTCKYYSDGNIQRTNLRECMRGYFKL